MTTQIKSITYSFKDGKTFATIVSQPYLELANGELIEDPKGVHSVSFELSEEVMASNEVHISNDETCALCDILQFDQAVILAAIEESKVGRVAELEAQEIVVGDQRSLSHRSAVRGPERRPGSGRHKE